MEMNLLPKHYTGHFHFITPGKLGEQNGKLVVENKDFVIFYVPGRTVYRGSDEGSQYQPAEYFLLKKGGQTDNGFWAEEIMKFPRSV